MAALWLAVVIVGGVSLGDETSAQTGWVRTADCATPYSAPVEGFLEEGWVPPRTGRELLEAARAALARWAKPSDADADLAAREFLALYGELQSDSQLAATQREPILSKIRGRLAALQGQIEKRMAHQQRQAAEGQRPAAAEAGAWDGGVLAQWGGPMGGPGRGGGMMGGMMPGMMGGGLMGGGPAQAADNSQELIDLIQRVIAPSTWDVNGGAGSIYYWRPGRALVIRNHQGVHEQIGDLLDQLNRSGP